MSSSREYLQKKVNPILEKLVLELLRQEPENTVIFINSTKKIKK